MVMVGIVINALTQQMNENFESEMVLLKAVVESYRVQLTSACKALIAQMEGKVLR